MRTRSGLPGGIAPLAGIVLAMRIIMKERYIREIIEGFPYPIAAVFVRLRTDECLDPGSLRLKYILATAEAIARFLGVVALVECRDYLEERGGTPSLTLSVDFVARFRRITWGN